MKLGLVRWLSLAVAVCVMLPAPLRAQSARVALVIGNSSYPDASTPLPTTTTDARTLADELRQLQFEVDLKLNVGKEDMQRAIDAFLGKIKNGTNALLYFSGFGLQVDRQNYLIPVNAQIWTEADVRRDGIKLDDLLDSMQRRGAKIKIIIIDAARRNPFERRFRVSAAGLAPLGAPDGTLALFSVAPGAVIRDGDTANANSVLVTELVKELLSPNQTAEQAFNRTRIGVSRASNNEIVPWVSSSLLEDFYFRPGGAQPQTAAEPPPPPAAMTPPPPMTKPPPMTQPPPVASPAPTYSPTPPPSPAPSVASPRQPAPSNPPPAPQPSGAPPSHIEPGQAFRDCSDCPDMVAIAAGSFTMGAHTDFAAPAHRVTIGKDFAIGRYEITFDEWDRCVSEGGCKTRPDDRGWGRGRRPIINVSWLDAEAFVTWLSQKTGHKYRLPSEAEWEYAARGGTTSNYWWGGEIGSGHANCQSCGTGQSKATLPVGSFAPNGFGLYDTAGNVAEWVEDCWHDDYRGAPTDGSVWNQPQCQLRVLRGGAYDSDATYVGSASRFRYDYDVPYSANGFRVVREMR
jgi:formylglycine-generating enzyme required for sulfatase activity